MIKKNVLDFLKLLKKNNNRPWFELNKKTYEEARADFTEHISQVITILSAIDSGLAHLTVKDCMFRINRDVRFSKDKRPYKHNMSAYFNKAGKKGNGAGYYVHIEPGGSFIAAGIWVPEAADLAKIRQEIDYNLPEFKKIVESRSFKKHFNAGLDMSNTLVRPPKGYDDQNPALDFIKLKSFVVRRGFDDAAITGKDFTRELTKTFGEVKPFIDFLNRALD